MNNNSILPSYILFTFSIFDFFIIDVLSHINKLTLYDKSSLFIPIKFKGVSYL